MKAKGILLAAWVGMSGAFLTGCYDPQQIKAFLREPRSPVAGVKYCVLPPDVIEVRSRKVVEINGVSQQVRPDGKINLPLLGEIYVAGLTPREIEASVVKAASKHYQAPDCTVLVRAYHSQRFYIFGQVARPGVVPWTGHDTLLDALARAQPTSLAWPERILLIRGSTPTEGGYATTQPSGDYAYSGVRPPEKGHPRRRLVVNLRAMIEHGDLSNNVLLMPNDIVYVPANPLAQIGLALQNLLFPIRPAAETVRTPFATATAVGGTP